MILTSNDMIHSSRRKPLSSDIFTWKGRTGYLTVYGGDDSAASIAVQSTITGKTIITGPNDKISTMFDFSNNNKPYTLRYFYDADNITFEVTYER